MTFFVTLGNLALIIPSHLTKNPVEVFNTAGYSAAANGGFCTNCVLFGGEITHSACKLQRLMTSPIIPSTSTAQKLSQHAQKSKVHETATMRASEFRRLFEGKRMPIDVQLSNARRELMEKNRMRLHPIIDAIITCGRQNIALRGHRDDSQYYIEDDTTNPGNFIEIVKYVMVELQGLSFEPNL